MPRARIIRCGSRAGVKVDRLALDRGLDLLEVTEGLGTFDAVLAATAIEAEASSLVSADRAFSRVDGLRHLPLDGVELESMLR